MNNSSEKLHPSTPLPKTTITPKSSTHFETFIDDWNTPLSNEELDAIDAAFEAATQSSTTPFSSPFKTPITHFTIDGDGDTRPTARRQLPGSILVQNGELEAIQAAIQPLTTPSTSSLKTPRSNSYADGDDGHTRPKARRRLPGSISGQNGELGSSCSTGSFAPTPCSRSWSFRQDNVKMKYPALNFWGRIVYSRTNEEVEEATLQILKMLEARRCETGKAVVGLDIEWKPSFDRGIPQGKAAVMQICGDMTHCYVLHIFHSGIPGCLQSLLENSAFTKVGVGIDNDAVKVFHDHNVSIKSLEDLSYLANQKLGGVPKQWSLSGLVEMFTCKQLLKPKKIRLGNWETDFLSKAQLRYAATDAFASWYLYEVLMSFPDLPENQES